MPQRWAHKTFLRKRNKRIAPGTGLEVKCEEQVEAAEWEEGSLYGKGAGGCLPAKAGCRAVSGETWQVKYFCVQGNDLDFFLLSLEANPEKFNSRFRNKMFYAGVSVWRISVHAFISSLSISWSMGMATAPVRTLSSLIQVNTGLHVRPS